MDDAYKVEVVEYDSDAIVKTLEAATERTANRIDDGLNINLDHANFYTRIVPPKESK